ncbi:hypothetical protein OG735_23990 [Streptomyces sp. NBC_01210]|uniref:hypothetical protein n=1 Tax=Streptomyces sp. NBC_01210 TaxID=2903774 RepID=UPI002E161C2F|nr:hypothetical protein OG735_23990 [Streptomyces sp. NBC_01210]
MTALTGVVRQPRFWLRLLVLVAIPLIVTLILGHQAAWAADDCRPKDEVPNLYCEPPKTTDGGKVLGVFDVVDKNGVPISAYGLNVDQGGTFDVLSKINAFLISMGFGLIKIVIGFACWLVAWALDFGLAKTLLDPVSDVAATIKLRVLDRLELKVLFLTLATVWAGYHILFKKRSKGWAEISMSLVIASLATVTLANPGAVLIGNADDTGVLGTTKQFSLTIADVVLEDDCAAGPKAGTDKNTKPASCSGQNKGDKKADAVSRPITDGLVDAFIQRPVWVLYTGKPIDGKCSAAYGKSTLARYNFNRIVLPRIIEKMEQDEADDSWLDDLGKAFADAFSLTSLKDALLIATGNPWAIYTVVTENQQQAVDKFRKDLEKTPAWEQYVKPADQEVEAACGGGRPLEDQQLSASLDNVLSVWFIALAALIVVVLVVAVSLTFLTSQVWMAIEVIRAQPALVAGILPGGGRTAMWNWVSGVTRVVLAIFMSVMFLTFFLIMVIAVLDARTGEIMTVKFLTIDILAVGFVVFRKKVTAAAKNIATNFGQRMASKTGGAVNEDELAPSAFYNSTAGAPSALSQLKDDKGTLGKMGKGARDLWLGKPKEGGAEGGAAGRGGGGGGGKPKKNLKQRIGGAIRVGTEVAAAVGSGGTTAAVQATAKTALKNRLKNAAKNRLSKNRVGRATLATARTGRYIAKEAPVTRGRLRDQVGESRRDLERESRQQSREGDQTRNAQRDANRQMRQTRSQQRNDGQRLNRTLNNRRNQQQNRRRSGGNGRNNRRNGRGGGGNGS